MKILHLIGRIFDLRLTADELDYVLNGPQLAVVNTIFKVADRLALGMVIIGVILAILAIIILWNQHKIKKMLRQLQEEKTKEDKP